MSDDELEPLVTECPNCLTRFRVSDTQLQVAGGRVRCGACLTVFQGVDRLLWEKEPDLAEGQAREVLDELLDELDDPTDEAPDNVAESGNVDPENEPPDPGEDVEVNIRLLDDVAVEELVLEDLPGGGVPNDSIPELTKADASNEDASNEDMSNEDASRQDVAEVEQNSGEEAANDAPEEDEPQEQVMKFVVAADGEDSPEVRDTYIDGLVTVADSQSLQSSLNSPIAAEGIPEAPRVPISFAREKRQTWWVPLTLVIAVAAVIAQVAYWQFDDWSRNLKLRPAYEWFCTKLGCELPVLRDLDQLVLTKLVVRSHPEREGVLIVDAIIVNEAPFEQPFPVLELRFTSLAGNLVASGRFEPARYLAGELQGAKVFERFTPVRIELEFEDPGSDAVNYFMDFR